MNPRNYSHGGYSIPEPDKSVVKQFEDLGFEHHYDNLWSHPDCEDITFDISFTEKGSVVALLHETFFLAGCHKIKNQIKSCLGE